MTQEKSEYRCLTVNNPITRKHFLALPRKLYNKHCPQNIKTERDILLGKHPISKDIEIFPFVVLNKNNSPVCRCLVTYYKGTDDAYVGFFESKKNVDAVNKMLVYVIRKAQSDGKKRLVGPIDASIYINYRFKTNMFDKTYTGEPYNKDYYPDLWERCGFIVTDRYISNQQRRVMDQDFDERIDRVYKRYLDRGYQFTMPNNNFKQSMEDVYELLMDRFAKFKGYQKLDKEQFMSMFGHLESIADMNMIKLAYKNSKLQGFCIALPNYGFNTLGNLTPMKLFNILRIRKKPTEYVVLYAGADKKTPGLGAALMQAVRNELHENQCTSIAALIHEGNMPESVYPMLHTEQCNYVLMAKDVPEVR